MPLPREVDRRELRNDRDRIPNRAREGGGDSADGEPVVGEDEAVGVGVARGGPGRECGGGDNCAGGMGEGVLRVDDPGCKVDWGSGRGGADDCDARGAA